MRKLKKVLFEEFDAAVNDYNGWKDNQEEINDSRIATKVLMLQALSAKAGLETAYIKWKAKRVS